LRRSASDATAERVRDAPTRSPPYVCRLLGSIRKIGNELPRPSHKCYLRAAHRRRQGPQARAAGRSGAESLDDAEHSSTLTIVMGEQREYGRTIRVESAARPTRDPQRERIGNARANGAQIAGAFRERSRHRHRGVSNPPGRPRDGSGLKAGGLLTPPLNHRHCLSATGARQRTPRSLWDFSGYKSSPLRDLREKTSWAPPQRRAFSSDSLAFPNRANHRGSSRPPSRRQPFADLRVADQGKEKSSLSRVAAWLTSKSGLEMSDTDHGPEQVMTVKIEALVGEIPQPFEYVHVFAREDVGGQASAPGWAQRGSMMPAYIDAREGP
jgi:hypothetical protein